MIMFRKEISAKCILISASYTASRSCDSLDSIENLGRNGNDEREQNIWFPSVEETPSMCLVRKLSRLNLKHE